MVTPLLLQTTAIPGRPGRPPGVPGVGPVFLGGKNLLPTQSLTRLLVRTWLLGVFPPLPIPTCPPWKSPHSRSAGRLWAMSRIKWESCILLLPVAVAHRPTSASPSTPKCGRVVYGRDNSTTNHLPLEANVKTQVGFPRPVENWASPRGESV